MNQAIQTMTGASAMKKTLLSVAVTFALVCGWPAVASAGTARTYLAVFSYDDVPPRLAHSHVFELFVEVESGRVRRSVTLSWLPQADGSSELHPFGDPETGVNASLERTLKIAQTHHRHVAYWPVLETDPELFARAEHRAAVLGSSAVGFVAFDAETSAGLPTLESGGTPDGAVAINGITAGNVLEPRAFGMLSGRFAAQALLGYFGPYLLATSERHPEVLQLVPSGTGSLADRLKAMGAEAQPLWPIHFREH
jgi:hypothetical protein